MESEGKNKIGEIKELQSIFQGEQILIPNYQRPYRWPENLVTQLVDDLISNRGPNEYRLGTIVFYRDKDRNKLEVVDGQQRLVTLSLLLHHLGKKEVENSLIFTEVRTQNKITKWHIKKNSALIFQKLKLLDEDAKSELADFILTKCEVVYVELGDISEAFQFFDSQNARGKALSPHDLLKAYHLREIVESDSEKKEKIVKTWETGMEKQQVQNLMDDYLYRIRNWSKGKSAKRFNNSEIDIFKGVNLKKEELYNYIEIYRIGNHFINSYKEDPIRAIDRNTLTFPFQIDQVILNGERFFEYIDHYLILKKKIEEHEELKEITEILDNYRGRKRVGDIYTRNLFNCVILQYLDKFGDKNLKEVGNLAFLWAYRDRLLNKAVKLATIDNRGMGKSDISLFKVIREAVHPKEVLNIFIPPIKEEERKGTHLGDIVDKYNKLGGYHGEKKR